jgi:hypothetical protein
MQPALSSTVVATPKAVPQSNAAATKARVGYADALRGALTGHNGRTPAGLNAKDWPRADWRVWAIEV